jgi:hypothetical protein
MPYHPIGVERGLFQPREGGSLGIGCVANGYLDIGSLSGEYGDSIRCDVGNADRAL